MTRYERQTLERWLLIGAIELAVVILGGVVVGWTFVGPFIVGNLLRPIALLSAPHISRLGICPIIGHRWFASNRVTPATPQEGAQGPFTYPVVVAIWTCERCWDWRPRDGDPMAVDTEPYRVR